jgi:hypothetical protein
LVDCCHKEVSTIEKMFVFNYDRFIANWPGFNGSYLVCFSFRDGVGKKPAASLSLNLKPGVSFSSNVGFGVFFVVT